MTLSRRKFLQLVGGSTAAMGLSQLWLPKVVQAILENPGNPPVIWFQGQGCTGCAVSTLNTAYPDIASVLTKIISLEFHPTVMAAAGDSAIKVLDDALTNQSGKFILVVEGSVPTQAAGAYCSVGEIAAKPVTALDWVTKLGNASKAVLNVGTCSSFGGIPAGRPNPTGAKPVSEILPGKTMINLPGCPPHPDWIIGTIAHVLLYGLPELDEKLRPKVFYKGLIHENCERRYYFENGQFAKDYGEEGCLFELGCKGPIAHCDVSTRGWNGGVNWCCRSGGPCIGCTEPTFPDHGGSGLYGLLDRESIRAIPWRKAEADTPKKLVKSI
ncbi:MAG: hydrogenase small subunit [Candidatus Zixiibacteriota bacterium]